jgi:hypothetical protein
LLFGRHIKYWTPRCFAIQTTYKGLDSQGVWLFGQHIKYWIPRCLDINSSSSRGVIYQFTTYVYDNLTSFYMLPSSSRFYTLILILVYEFSRWFREKNSFFFYFESVDLKDLFNLLLNSFFFCLHEDVTVTSE